MEPPRDALRAPRVDRALEGSAHRAALEGEPERAALLHASPVVPLPVRARARSRSAAGGVAGTLLAGTRAGRLARPRADLRRRTGERLLGRAPTHAGRQVCHLPRQASG